MFLLEVWVPHLAVLRAYLELCAQGLLLIGSGSQVGYHGSVNARQASFLLYCLSGLFGVFVFVSIPTPLPPTPQQFFRVTPGAGWGAMCYCRSILAYRALV